MSFNSSSPPDWLMPEGVSKTQWEYISNQYIASNYDSSLKDNPVFHQEELQNISLQKDTKFWD